MTPDSDSQHSRGDALGFAFAPIHKAALGVAVGLVCGLFIFALTLFHLVLQPLQGPNVALLGQYFYGYTISWPGALIGFAWGGGTGFVLGWFMAFIRNLVVSIIVFALKTKAELERTADFLDHI
jgi:hypothetical protein